MQNSQWVTIPLFAMSLVSIVKIRINLLWKKGLDIVAFLLSQTTTSLSHRGRKTPHLYLDQLIHNVVKLVKYSSNTTSHESFFFYTIFQIHYENTKLKLYTVICNFNQLKITFIKCAASKTLTAYIIPILKSSINSQYLLILLAVMILDETKCHVRG